MKEERSILEYVSERISFSGKLKSNFSIENYLKNLNSEDYTLDKNMFYISKSKYDSYIYSENTINKIDFRIGALIDKMLNNLDSTEFEKHIKSNKISLNENLDAIESVIAKHSDVDKDRLKVFCKYNIGKTQSPFGLYVYLLLARNVDIKKDEKLFKDILKIALVNEYTAFMDEYIIDAMPESDYIRGYLLRRIRFLNPALDDLFRKKEIKSFEDRNWVLTELVKNMFNIKCAEKIDLLDILENWNLNEEQFLGCVRVINHELGACNFEEDFNEYLGKCIEVLAVRYKEQPLKLEIIKEVSSCMGAFAWSLDIQKETTDKYRKILSNAVATPEALDLLKEKIYNPDTDKVELNQIYKIVTNLDIKEFYLEIYNRYKENPVKNERLIYIFENQKELELKALTLLYERLDWDEIVGEYSSKKDLADAFGPEETLINKSANHPELAIKVYTKMLRAKVLQHRESAFYNLYKLDLDYAMYSDELVESIEYLAEHELNTRLKEMAEQMLGMNEEVEYSDPFSRMKKYNFNLVGVEDNTTENKEKKQKINLKTPRLIFNCNSIFSNLGVDFYSNKQMLYYTETQDEFYGYCQGEEFGDEYLVRILMDKKYNFKTATCTCGECKKDKFCSHVAALITYISKDNDRRQEELDKKK